MATIKNKNFSKGHLAKLASMGIQNGDTFEACNFVQIDPHTKILEGYTGLTFKDCNMLNCDPPPDATLISCPNRHRSFCTHINPSKVGASGECVENCSHVVDTDTVTIDGQVVDTTYHYEDTEVV